MRTQGPVGVRVGAVVGRARARRRGKQLGTLGIAAIALALLAPVTAEAQVETSVSANAGWVSQYYYRGILQTTSSASAGLDVSMGAVSLGTWLADVGDGAEIDFYGSVGADVEEVSVSAGAIAYMYTGQFDDTYIEANLGAGYGPLSAEFSFGQYENFGGALLGLCVLRPHSGARGVLWHIRSLRKRLLGVGARLHDLGDPERFGSIRHVGRRREPDARAHPGVRDK